MLLFLDGDSCPVRNEAYRVGTRYGWHVFLVSNHELFVPPHPLIDLVICKGFGEVDNCIAENVGLSDIVVTHDLGLAARCLTQGALALNPRGYAYSASRIADHFAQRSTLGLLRRRHDTILGPRPMTRKDRSRFLAKLEQTIHIARRFFQQHAA